MIELDIQFSIHKRGTLHQACWIPKDIYSFKIELLFNEKEATIALTGGWRNGIYVITGI